jgi:acetate kinase
VSGASAESSSPSILAINAGSSSLKVTLFGFDEALPRRASATVERIGLKESAQSVNVPDFDAALRLALERIDAQVRFKLLAVGHRVVHGGVAHTEPKPITPSLLADLRQMESIDPTHTPQALSLIAAVERHYPSMAQFACFDTAFHRTMPAVARQYPLPRRTWSAGIWRYGFHGLSCESIVEQLRRTNPVEADGRVLIAHLGNGASITAVHHGASVDTSMGFSPTGGLMMGTRSGDLDPSVITYLAKMTGDTPDALERLVTEESGLLGVSGLSSDMREVLSRTGSSEAREAVALYCYTARKHVAALAGALNGVDTIVFTGGIGERAPAIRAGICAGLEFLGVEVAPEPNAAGGAIISRPGSRVVVRVMQTDEDLVIARHVQRLLG